MKSIYLVEDEQNLQFLYKRMLEHLGFDVLDIADNGEDAILKYKQLSQKPDIILMDYRMPKKNGLDTAKQLLSIDNTLKIIFISADISIKKEALSIGAISFKEKPFTLEKLKANLEKVIKLTNSNKN